jgi:hypothetical protein
VEVPGQWIERHVDDGRVEDRHDHPEYDDDGDAPHVGGDPGAASLSLFRFHPVPPGSARVDTGPAKQLS